MTAATNVTPIVTPYVGIVAVAPDTAQRWLTEFNRNNRKVRQGVVDAYARDMKAGNWKLTAEPIKFAPDGTLLDGQHRLAAVVKANVTICLFVARGIDPAAQQVMDSGAKRTTADALQLAGSENVVIRAAIGGIALAAQNGNPDAKAKYTHSEILAFLGAHPTIGESARFASRYARRTDVPPAMVGYTHWMFARINAAAADQFWIDASEKVGLSAGDPVIALTNRFAEARRNRERMPRSVQLSLIYRAWNYRRDGKTARVLRVNSPAGGLVPIPEPK